MALDRWIALIILIICLTYGYAAFFTMDDSIPPFMRRDPIWPSTFPKILSVLAVIVSLGIVLGLEKSDGEIAEGDINYRRLQDYKIGQAVFLLGLMVAYAFTLRPIGFLGSTSSFIIVGAFLLGERRWVGMILSGVLAAGIVWFLVQILLEVYLLPLPEAFGDANRAFVRATQSYWDAFIDLFRSAEATA